MWLSWEALLLNVPRVSLGLFLLPLDHLRSLRPPGCFDAWDFLAKVHGVDVRAYGAALLSVCTFAACVIGVASTLLSMLDEPRARYGSCVLAARRAPSTLRWGSASTPLTVLSGRSICSWWWLGCPFSRCFDLRYRVQRSSVSAAVASTWLRPAYGLVLLTLAHGFDAHVC